MRIGVVSPRWLPDFGGAQIYVDRLAQVLLAAGHDLRIATASAGESAPVPVDRFSAAPLDTPAAWERWYDSVEAWIAAGRFTHVMMNTPLARGSHLTARRLYVSARAAGVRVGCLHYDLGREVTTELAYAYARQGSWPAAAAATLARSRALIADQGIAEAYRLMESPLLFEPDFVLSCSEWSGRFIDPLDRCTRLVLRPLMAPHWQPASRRIEPTAMIGFVNPLPHKGVDRLIEVMRDGPRDWTYRILGGGYGDAFARVASRLREAAPGRVELVPYVADIRDFYAGVGVVMFASLYEGYGMAAVEPAFVGTPTVATDYPAIREGVGDAARIVPYAGSAAAWIEALGEVLAARDIWSAKALDRAAYLLARQAAECESVIAALAHI